ncbi:hypothetical protein RIR_jg16816.t1 [Rhizophagus irregularis DAOM 181602=DAOM 197198]|nr:hypothetical protein RIR_jg16816.t1 [Rhizophagus irregularis DAOM 181602=DAOM 197198]
MVSEKLFLSIIRPKTLSWSKKRSKFCFEKKNREISIKDVLQEEKKTTGIRKLLTNNFRPSKTIEGEVVNKMLTLVVIKKEENNKDFKDSKLFNMNISNSLQLCGNIYTVYLLLFILIYKLYKLYCTSLLII